MGTAGANREQVQRFLDDFHQKTRVFNIVFRDHRDKNFNALLKLEISSYRRTEIIAALQVEDYSEGPLTDTLYKLSDMWVFGKTIKKQEVYIKITLGALGTSVICISFHLAEHKMHYPLK